MSEAPEGLHVDERRLAAILAADVTGYSRLMGRDTRATRPVDPALANKSARSLPFLKPWLSALEASPLAARHS
jgi:hypothetical protein